MIRLALVVGVLAALAGIAAPGFVVVSDVAACTRGYSPCLPVRKDLDCGQIANAKKPIRVVGADPYRLDADRNGLGCQLAGRGGGRRSPWGLILRNPSGKEATQARVGNVLTAVGWSPSSFRGERFRLCNVVKTNFSSQVTCAEEPGPRGQLKGTVQRLGTWLIRIGQSDGGAFKLTLRVNGKVRAVDTVPLG
ncbi:MAG: hypothetical protein H0U46_08615 [Actinobacteria bacterium]|nr:hypothetical protein [Actinomycetota bacterium]